MFNAHSHCQKFNFFNVVTIIFGIQNNLDIFEKGIFYCLFPNGFAWDLQARAMFFSAVNIENQPGRKDEFRLMLRCFASCCMSYLSMNGVEQLTTCFCMNLSRL